MIVLGHNEGRGGATDDYIKAPFAHVRRMRDGKAERVQVPYDRGSPPGRSGARRGGGGASRLRAAARP